MKRVFDNLQIIRKMFWSGRPDLNRRPPAPKAGALPGCATPRQVGLRFYRIHFVIAIDSGRNFSVFSHTIHRAAHEFTGAVSRYLSTTNTSCAGVESFKSASYPPEVIFPLTK